MARSLKKGPYVDFKVLKKVMKYKASGRSHYQMRIWARGCCILPEFVGHTFQIYNGKVFIPATVNDQMVGHKFGEFAPTRTFRGHGGVDKTKKKK